MRDDLLAAKACIDWAVSQIPPLEDRLKLWLDLNMQCELRELEAHIPDNLLVVVEKEPFPLSFNAEVGAYVNSIRTSLDLLATSLAHRYSVPDPDKHYFPVAASETKFLAGDYKGSKFIKALPPGPCSKIEALKPYEGGNTLLWFLHHFDNVRKHRRLLSVQTAPIRFNVIDWGLQFTPTANPFLHCNGETVMGFIPKGRDQPTVTFSYTVTLEDVGFKKPVTTALRDFASFADSVISLFDTV